MYVLYLGDSFIVTGKAVVYEKIGLAVSSQEYNHTTQMHHIFVMWSNPGAPVDEYLVLVMTIGRKQSRRINAVSSHHFCILSITLILCIFVYYRSHS